MPRRVVRVVVPESTQPRALARPLFAAEDDASGPRGSDPLEFVLASIQRGEKRRKPSSFLQDAFNNCKGRAEMEERARSVFAPREVSPSGWACQGCQQPDRSKLVPSPDKAGWVCSLCGACDGATNLQETDYQASTRTVRMHDDEFARSLSATEFADAAKRRQARAANSATGAPLAGALRSAQERTVREATAEDATQTLGVRDRKRMEKAMMHLHAVFRAAGLDPDSNPICKCAFDLASRLFSKAAVHMQVCTNRNRTCMVAMVRHADTKLIGKACIAHVLKQADAAAAQGEAFESVAAPELKGMANKLAEEMAAYNKAVGVAREAETTIERVVSSSQATLCVACDDNDAEPDDGPSEEPATNTFPLALPSQNDDAQGSECVDAFLERLSVSLLSAKTIGWIDERILSIAQKHVVSVACYDWICEMTTWSADVVAGIVCVKTLAAMKFSTTQTFHTLKKLAKRHKITMLTVQSAVDSMPPPCV